MKVVDEVKSDKFKNLKYVKQGCVLSPIIQSSDEISKMRKWIK